MLEYGAGIIAVGNGMRGFRFHLLPEEPAEVVNIQECRPVYEQSARDIELPARHMVRDVVSH